MDIRKNKLPLKLIFGVVSVLTVFAFSMALTTVTKAQAGATDTPTATETLAPGASATPGAGSTTAPSTGATSTPAPSGAGSTGTIPVTGANTARSAAISKEINKLSNISDARLENMFNDLRSQVRRLMSNAKDANDRDDRNDRDDWRTSNSLSSSAASSNGTSANQNGNASSSQMTTDDMNIVSANSNLSAIRTLLDSNASGFDADGKVINRQVAINTLARVQVDVRRAAFWINGSDSEERSERNEK